MLVVEDDRLMADLLRQGLSEEGHAVLVASDGQQGFDLAGVENFDVIVLDVMLPRLDGFAVARKLRQDGNRTPILMLTARDSMRDVVAGLDLGADDYLTKPFSFDVLLARLRSVSRRGPVAQPACLQVRDLSLNPANREVRRGERRIPLTRTEFSLLELLMRRSGNIVPRETLMRAAWGYDSDVRDNTLDAFVRLLRNKVDHEPESRLIHTVRGIGYRLSAEP